ncbi:MAG: tRNA(Met) cytidine acetyltransferase TmcA [Canidatus Methanoxibalbensis ujae]|nr:tRNA(Met) cytidine acetyltransferase TmcA [Candidatus Methanoxibalbensis ujae]
MVRLSRELRAEIERAAANAIDRRHRFMIMLCTAHLDSDTIKLAKKIYDVYEKVKKSAEQTGNNTDLNSNLNSNSNSNKKNPLLIVGRSKFLDIASSYFEGKFVHFADSEKLLGETYASLILDLTEGFHPNDLGIIIETISEGGIMIMIAPPVDAWKELRGKWHYELVSAPYSIDDITPRFYQRFIRRTLSAEGTIIYNVDSEKIEKKYEFERDEESREEIKIPENTVIKRKLYKLCATNDQVRFLQIIERFFERKKSRKYVVLTADRGRGKTAVLGIVTPFLISRMYSVLKRPVRIIVVAPSPNAVQTYFVFLRKALLRQGMRRFRSKETSDGLTTVVSTRFARVEYVIPRRALVEKDFADIIIVDEASAIDVPVLREITKNVTYAIFSSTIHGYEGAGRGFSIRFLRTIEKEDVEVEKMHMYEPIRYGCGDPIEKWLYDVLLLDAKPAYLDEDDLRAISAREYSFEIIDKDEILNDERAIREFFGIYVLAHYRNRPSDVAILLDMPNHIAFRVSVRGKTVCSLHVAVEGGIEDDVVIKRMTGDFKPRGQMIPDLMVKHYLLTEFPKVCGIRIVRIATHPSLMRRHIGSFALESLLKWASSRFKWVGAGFGVSPELLRFWMRNGFVPVHITPQRNEISGEYSVVVLRALDSDFADIIERTNACFVSRLTEYLCDELRDIDVDAAILMLRSLMRDTGKKCEFGDVERERMQKYFEGISIYEYIADVARPLVRAFYSRSDKVELSEIEERVVVAKCLQLKRWWEIIELQQPTAQHTSSPCPSYSEDEKTHVKESEGENEGNERNGSNKSNKNRRNKKNEGEREIQTEGRDEGSRVYETLQKALLAIWQWHHRDNSDARPPAKAEAA